MKKLICNLDVAPFVPSGWEVVEHRTGGQLEFDPAKIALFFSENQKGNKLINGDDLREELKSRLVFNANLIDFLLAHPNLIPEEWKEKVVFFWGTIYRRPDGHLCVRCLGWSGKSWFSGYVWLGNDWDFNRPAAVPA
jgi:hypothetical protein